MSVQGYLNLPHGRLAVVLPVAQSVLAATLLHWGQSQKVSFPLGPQMLEICFGLNAPAIPFLNARAIVARVFDARWQYEIPWKQRLIFGHGTDYLFFLCGVIALWYFVGQALDHRRASVPTRRNRRMTFVLCLLLLVYGVVLGASGIFELGPGRVKELDPPVGAVLFLIWSAILIFKSGRRLIIAVRTRRHLEATPAEN